MFVVTSLNLLLNLCLQNIHCIRSVIKILKASYSFMESVKSATSHHNNLVKVFDQQPSL